MRFRHAGTIWSAHPELSAGVLYASGVAGDADVGAGVAEYTGRALARLADATEGQLPEVLAWRRAFARMGLKPTQYRCASESLLRRLRKERALPSIHPVVDLCNAVSVAYGVPVAALDADRIAGPLLEVRHARGDEHYTTFGGETEHPAVGEVTFVDSEGRAHARRWTNRQSGHSAVGPHTARILVVVEAMHEGGGDEAETVPEMLKTLAEELAAHWRTDPRTAVLSASAPEFTFGS
ncbi:phenylalanine--tRNA ligase beta subunit-related protein [Streptomyces sp. NBC_00237]|uniref:B3/B4 domain-containing protein n=1 Tax=Streptomyces sp. NBC_00237 TaxID=2975687 RepID=UPI002250CAEE|nr:phenylalanine--tRNA ligase beta subunit-related protein [Streptomyces sp. NBC_00237]MCX5206565.1 phenylalanine--tRNA ligase beta subunit-related protein [Streptomyces sp. NBC_00237]